MWPALPCFVPSPAPFRPLPDVPACLSPEVAFNSRPRTRCTTLPPPLQRQVSKVSCGISSFRLCQNISDFPLQCTTNPGPDLPDLSSAGACSFFGTSHTSTSIFLSLSLSLCLPAHHHHPSRCKHTTKHKDASSSARRSTLNRLTAQRLNAPPSADVESKRPPAKPPLPPLYHTSCFTSAAADLTAFASRSKLSQPALHHQSTSAPPESSRSN